MAIVSQPPAATLPAAWIEQARTHPWTALGLAVAALAMLLLLATSVWQVLTGAAQAPLRLALLGGTAAFGATALGAIPGIALKGIDQRLEDSMLGLAAGMMLAASSARARGRRGPHRQRLPRRRHRGGGYDPRGPADAGPGSVHPP